MTIEKFVIIYKKYRKNPNDKKSSDEFFALFDKEEIKDKDYCNKIGESYALYLQ